MFWVLLVGEFFSSSSFVWEMSGGSGCSVVWFRRDLRVEDNPALLAGVRAGGVVALFIWAPEEEGTYYPGRVSRWWLKHSLAHLDSSLRSLGTPLITKRSTDSVSSLLEVCLATGATQLFFNHLYGQFFFLFFCSYLYNIYFLMLFSVFCILFEYFRLLDLLYWVW